MCQISLISLSRLLPSGCSRRVLCFGARNDNSRVTDLSPVSTAVLVLYCVLESGTMILVSQISHLGQAFLAFSLCTVFWSRGQRFSCHRSLTSAKPSGRSRCVLCFGAAWKDHSRVTDLSSISFGCCLLPGCSRRVLCSEAGNDDSRVMYRSLTSLRPLFSSCTMFWSREQ